MRYGGWYQIAFENEIEGDLASFRISNQRFLCVRGLHGIEVYDAVCPHRGADLGIGGKLDGDAVICPYHAHRISLGERAAGYCVKRFPSMTVGGLVFVLVGLPDEGEFPSFIAEVTRTYQIVPGWKKSIRVAPELVIENAFDADHFMPVHDVIEVKTTVPETIRGVFTLNSVLQVGPSAWQGGENADPSSFVNVPLLARAFSPNLTVTSIGIGVDNPHFVIAGATPQPDGNCLIRLSVAIPLNPDGPAPDPSVANMILEFESFGLEQDRPVWENLTTDIIPRYDPERDATVLAYRQWCKRFEINGRRNL